jgi:hypothetical protein
MATVDTLVRFVSLVPSIPDAQAFGDAEGGGTGSGGGGATAATGADTVTGLLGGSSGARGLGAAAAGDVASDLWATTQQCLDMGAGDSEEHAVMLANFFTWLDGPSAAANAGPPVAALASSPAAAAGAGLLSSPAASAAMSPIGLRAGGSALGGGGSGDWRTFLVLGNAQPEGPVVWVARQAIPSSSTPPSAATTLLFDATAGRAYFASDDTCPLRSVGMLVDGHGSNAWANTQPLTEPWRCSWDVTDARAWSPLFSHNQPAATARSGTAASLFSWGHSSGTGFPFPGHEALPSVQPAPVYRAPDIRLAAALESEIHAALASALRGWRRRYITRIRGDLTSPLRGLLLELEARACGVAGAASLATSEGVVTVGGGGVGRGLLQYGPAGTSGMSMSQASAAAAAAARDLAAEHQAMLERIASRFRVHGFPLHTTFTDLEAVVSLVRSAGLHAIEEEAVQYVLAVAVVPYPNAIFSVWVYYVALLPN